MRSPKNPVVFLLVLFVFVAASLIPSAIRAQAAPQQAPAAAPAQAPAPAPAAAPAPQQAQSACGNSALCYEANDFTATITNFRTSVQGYLRIIDIVMRFQNKTNSPITLGYVGNSGTATDDRGNRYGVWGPNGVRGIGLVNGNTFDPKFSLRAGGFGDAQFELAWNPGQTVYGLTFQVDLTVDEINTVEGNQHTLGGEFPLHFVGLANGSGAASPAVTNLIPATGGGAAGGGAAGAANTVAAAAANPSAAAAPAAAGATQAACNTANQSGAASAATNVANAVNSIGSLFGKKKQAQNNTQSSNSSGPCDQTNGNSQAPAAGAAQAPPANQAGAKPAGKPAAK